MKVAAEIASSAASFMLKDLIRQ